MSVDPWSRPTLKDLQQILENIEKNEGLNLRETDRLELSVPAEIVTSRGNIVEAIAFVGLLKILGKHVEFGQDIDRVDGQRRAITDFRS